MSSTRQALVAALASCALGCSVWAQQRGSITTGGPSQRPIFLTGNVRLADGQLPPERPAIEVVCQGQAQPQGKADAKGNFNVQLGLNRFQGASDASVNSSAADTGFGGQLSGQTQVDGMSVMTLMGCSLRAALQGYRSESLDLSRVRLGESPVVGTIILHKLADVQGVTVSATGLNAPRNARNALERAREHLARGRPADAEKELATALKLHPKYAEAWHDLGSALEAQKRLPEARKAYLGAVASDGKFVPRK